ncbi:MAG: lipid-transfer protein [Acidimicrobiales bacterium]|jgi:acetyl-CoA acetyltransferase|nr:lipid-transfer protein [Acidimicrobiales bacterium]
MPRTENDIAIVGYAISPLLARTDQTETSMMLPVVAGAIKSAGLTKDDIGFTVSGSCDYLSGQAFSFVSNVDAYGAWPPINESHVEMDGAWALYEAYVRLLQGDIDTAVAAGVGKNSNSDPETLYTIEMDPYYLTPLGADPYSLAALQARALLESGKATEADFAEVVSRNLAAAETNEHALVSGQHSVEELLAEPYVRNPLRRHDLWTTTDGCAAVVLARGQRAYELCERPAWITGIDHRIEPHLPTLRHDLTRSVSTEQAAAGAGLAAGPVEVAELSAPVSYQELILTEALGLGDATEVNPSGGALGANPVMVTGLIRMIEAAKQITENGKHRTLAHATSGPCLQQNLVAILEGDE